MKKQLCYFILPISLLSTAALLNAEIITDGSVGPQVSITGPKFQIGEDLGSRTGNNLFHSFNTFDIFQGESAIFTGSSDIANVISRVTGGKVSTIDGLLQSQIGLADFYFINPNGVIFGQNAQIDVPSSFHVSSADSLNFSDGSQFNAVDPSASSLSVATPSSFGFTERQAARIVMDGSLISLNNDKHFSLSATKIEINNAQLSSESGVVSIVAVGEQDTQLELHTALLEQTELNAGGKLSLSDSQIDVSGDGAGQVNIAAGETSFIVSDIYNENNGANNQVQETNINVQSLKMDNAWIKNNSNASGQAASINLQVSDDLEMLNGSILSSSSFAAGDSGNVTVSAKNLLIDRNGSQYLTGIVSNANRDSSGNAGIVDVFVLENLDILNQGEIGSNTFSAGNAGTVTIDAGNLYIDGENVDSLTGISSQAVSGSTGQAGSIDILVADKIEIYDGGFISSSTFSTGQAGDINIETASLYINRYDADLTTGVFSNSSGNAIGDAGDVNIDASDWIAVVNGGKISSSTFAQGDAGNVQINTKQLYLDASGSTYNTGILSNAEEGSEGDAGQLDVSVSELTEIYSGASLGSNTFSQGNAGTVNLSSGDILIDDLGANTLTGIVSQTSSTGHAGELNIKVEGNFTLQNGGEVSTNTFAQGNAGTINIQTQELNINNHDSTILTGIVSNSAGSGDAGAVTIEVKEKANIINGGQIASSAFSSGDAGEVKISAQSMTIDRQDNDSITGILSNAQDDSQGHAGMVTVKTTGLLEVINGGKIVSSTNSIGNAGSVSIAAGELFLDSQGSSYFTGISSNAEQESTGNAGEIFVDVSGLISILDAAEIGSNTFAFGNAGEITVNTEQLFIDAGDSNSITGIFSDAITGSQGNGGVLNIHVSDLAVLQNGGKIASNAYASGNAGDIKLSAKNLTIDGQSYPFDTGITSIALEDSQGNAGSIDVQVEETLSILNGGEISTNTVASGNAGVIAITAQNITIDRQDNQRFTGIFSDAETGSWGAAGSLKVSVTDTLKVINGAWLSSSTGATGDAGDIEIISDSIILDAENSGVLTGIFSNAEENSSGQAGAISINNTGLISILNGASISSNTLAIGNAGSISVNTDNITMDAGTSGIRTGISSDASPTSNGHAGLLDILVFDAIEVLNGASITSTTFGLGDAGDVNISAGNITLDGQGDDSTGIFSSSESLDKGEAGSVNIEVKDSFSILNAAGVGSNTFSKGDAGEINVSGKNLLVDAGSFTLFTGIASQAGQDSTGDAGILNIQMSDTLALNNGGKISTNTFALGHAGDIKVSAANLSIDGQDNQVLSTGIFSNTRSTDAGNAGSIDIDVSNQLNISNGGEISSNTYSKGVAGFIAVDAGTIHLDRMGALKSTGIFSDAKAGSSGNAGFIQVTAQEQLTVLNGARISSNTEALGIAGDIQIQSNNISVDGKNSGILTGIFSGADVGSSGDAGQIIVSASGLVEVLGGAEIASSTFALGNAGEIQISANDMLIDIDDAGFITGVFSNAEIGSIGNAGQLSLDIRNTLNIVDGGRISTSTSGLGNAGDIKISASNLTIDRQGGFNTGIFSNTASTDLGNAGSIDIKISEQLNIINGGKISSDTFSKGYAGVITVAAGNLYIARLNSELFTGIFSDAKTDSKGNAGSITVKVTDSIIMDNGRITSSAEVFSGGDAGQINISANNAINLSNSSEIGSNTSASGDAGEIIISSKNLTINGTAAKFRTGIFSNAEEFSSGHAGSIIINAAELVEIVNGAGIASNTYGKGNAGDIQVSSKQVTLDGQNSSFRTGITSNAEDTSTGNAGFIQLLVTDSFDILSGARISSDTYANGRAGDIIINAGSLLVDSEGAPFASGIFSTAQEGSTGNAGQIALRVIDTLVISNGSEIGTSTEGSGGAGDVSIHAGNLIIDGIATTSFTGIGSDSFGLATGDAGQLEIKVDEQLKIVNGGEISSSTFTIGDAGTINIEAKSILMDIKNDEYTGISSASNDRDLSGQVGNIFITTDSINMNNGAVISISSSGMVENNSADIEQAITIQAKEVTLNLGSIITAKSTGNSPAANISVNTTGNLILNSESSITTESISSDAGPISIHSGLVSLNNSLITTSVSGQQGNGGNISVSTPALIMKSGFIQANTAASGASGGDILIDTPQLIFPSNQVFISNQNERIDFQANSPQNVIQAAAPDGVSGNVSVTAPTLDISSSILNISTRFSEQAKISKNPCKVSAGEIPSSLTWAGQGGLPSSHSDSINLPLGRRLRLKEASPKNKNDQSLHKQVPKEGLKSVPNSTESKLGCVASIY